MIAEAKKNLRYLRGLAWFVSYVFHPALLPTWLLFFIIQFVPSILNPITAEGRNSLLLVVFISTCAMPVLMLTIIMLLYKRKFSLDDLFMVNKSDRIFPFFFTGLYFIALTYNLFDQFGNVLYMIMMSISALILLLAIITIFWKISVHSAGMGGGLGILFIIAYLFSGADFLIPVLLLVFASGIVMTSRLFLHVHSVSQVYGGFLIGFIVCFLGTFLSFLL